MTGPSDPEAARVNVRALVEARALDRAATAVAAPVSTTVSAPVDAAAPAADEPAHSGSSYATRMVHLALKAGVELWHTRIGEEFVTIPVEGHLENHRLESTAIRAWLSRLHYTHMRSTPGTQAIRDAINTLGGIARYDGAEHDVHVRIGGENGAVYLDLGDPSWSVVEITASGWRVASQSPIRFRRGRAVLPLPAPVAGGSADALRDVIHVATDDDWNLIIACLVGALRPKGPYPVLGLDGEQGAGKSTAARMIRGVIDPSGADLRAEPREIRDLMVAAAGGWIIALDNLSHMPPWLSDALCRISTGGALSTRQLYTDGDEYLVEAVRPTIVTGITQVITRGDLQDRTIAMTLPAISKQHRRPEAELWRTFQRIRPQVLGALLDAVSCALRRHDEIRLPSLPRLADFALWVTAAEPALGYTEGTIIRAYSDSTQHAIEETLDGDPLSVAIRALPLPWEGTAAELLKQVTPPQRPRGWPESPRGMSGGLRRLAPQLRCVGIQVDFPPRKSTRRVIVICSIGAQPSPSSPASSSSGTSTCPIESGDGNGNTSQSIVSRPSRDLAFDGGRDDDGDGRDGAGSTGHLRLTI
jgi:hypothetical protein